MVPDNAEWVDSDVEAIALMCRFRGIFIASLIGEIEERLGRNFSSVFSQLPDTPTRSDSKYWFVDMPKKSSVRGRAKAMWAIRNAYTHGNGHFSRIKDAKVAAYLRPEFARLHFRGLKVEGDRVLIFKDVTFPALKTALEITDRFA
jgi:hypothetical protein